MIRNLFFALFFVFVGFAVVAPSSAAGAREFNGTIAAVAQESLLVIDQQRKEIVFVVNPGTRILRNGKPAVMSQLAIGDDVRVNALTRNSRWTAKIISAVGLD